MSQVITPLGGGQEKIQTSSNPTFGSSLSRQYQVAKNLFNAPNEWRENGRPIYWRLPAICQQYQVDFGFDQNSAYVYVPAGQNVYGQESMEIVPSDDRKTLVIRAGTIVWEHGSIKIDPVVMNLELIGMSNARYTVAYRLIFDDSSYSTLYSVDNYSLSGYPMNVGASTDSEIGWRYSPKLAFCEDSPKGWRNYDGVFPSYSESPFLYWQFSEAASLSEITLRCPENSSITGSATLSITNCIDPETGYCETPDWIIKDKVSVSEDNLGQFFSFKISEPEFNTGWRVDWTDHKIAINLVLISGSIPVLSKPAVGTTTVTLVAYPFDSLPPAIMNEAGKEVSATYCRLATVDVSPDYEVIEIKDMREIVGTDYQPIADWLTRPWDEDLIKIHQQVEQYHKSWMNPKDSLKHEYENLTSDLIEVQIEK